MSRAAVYDAIVAGTGLPEDNVLANYSGDGRPSDLDPEVPEFVVIRWQESTVVSQTYTGMSNGIPRAPRVLEVWAHIPKEVSTDFVRIDEILLNVENALLPMEHVAGNDGYTVTCIGYAGKSADNEDPGYNTICRYSAFTVLSRKT